MITDMRNKIKKVHFTVFTYQELQEKMNDYRSSVNIEFVVKYSDSDESEYVRIAMTDNKQYIDVIKDFVESIYKKNSHDKTVETEPKS
jgi:hypothetical protein